jgi:uncharacterized phage protein (TIGR01671 family)
MKREIKFKFWCKGTSTNLNFNKPGWWNWPNYLLEKYYNPQDLFDSPDFVCCQYTGLKDKNGKEIYEGDIICIPENDPTSTSGNALLTVEYRYGGFGYVDPTNKKFENIYYLIGDVDVDDCAEVVGNIFENPELLKV